MRERRKSQRSRWLRVLVIVQMAVLVGYAVLHSPLVPTLARAVGVHQPDFCYFVCR
jgi:hypothetical protein